MPLNFMFDDDIFISYSRADGGTYAPGLADELVKMGFSCFLDKRGTDASPVTPETLFKIAKRARLFVLLGTAHAAMSEHVAREVQEFAAVNGTSRIVPISFDKGEADADWSQARWIQQVVGLAREREDADALQTGNPSSFVVNRIEKQFQYARSKDRLRKYIRRALAAFVALLAASAAAGGFAFYQSQQALSAQQEATDARTEAKRARTQADEIIAQAKADVLQAQETVKQADEKRIDAERKTADAEDKRLDAEAEAKESLAQARAANDEAKRQTAEAVRQTTEAKRQQGIATSLELANSATRLLKQGPVALNEAVAAAVGSVRKAGASGVRTLETDNALRESLSLLPAARSTQVEFEGPNITFSLNPDASLVAALQADNTVQIIPAGRKQGTSFDRGKVIENPYHLALDNSGRRLATTDTRKVEIHDLKSADSWRIEPTGGVIERIALSPDGKYLAVIANEETGDEDSNGREDEIGTATFWDVEGEKQLAVMTNNLDIRLKSVAFSARGNVLAIGGRGAGGNGDSGYVVLWDLASIVNQMKRRDPQRAQRTDNASRKAGAGEELGAGEDKAESDGDKERAGEATAQQNLTRRQDSPQQLKDARADTEAWTVAFDRHRIVERQASSVSAVAPGQDVDQFAVTTAVTSDNYYHEVSVWQRQGRGVYEPTAYLPLPGLILNIAFRSDDTLAVVRERVPGLGPIDPEDRTELQYRQRYYEAWTAAGYVATVNVPVEREISTLAFRGAGDSLIVAERGDVGGSLLRQYDGPDVSRRSALTGEGEEVVKVLRGGKYAIVKEDGQYFVRYLNDSKKLRLSLAKGATTQLSDAVISEDGMMLVAPASKGEAEAIILYGLRGDTYAEHKTIVVAASSLSLTDDARMLAIIRDRRSVQILDTSDGRDITPPPLRDTLREIIDPYELSLSPNGRFLAMASIPSDRTGSQSLTVVETRSGKPVASGSHMNRINRFVFSADEKYLATAGQDNDAQILYLSETKKTATLHLSRPVKDAVFDARSKTLALVSDDDSSVGSSVSIFDAASARETTRLQHRQLVRALAFSRDGKYLATSSSVVEPDREDQSKRYRLMVWTLETNELLAEAERRIKALPVAINKGHVGLRTIEEGPTP